MAEELPDRGAPTDTTTDGAAAAAAAPSADASGDKKKQDKPKKPPKEKKEKPQQQQAKKKADEDTKGITVRKQDDLSSWYQEILNKGDFLEYSDIPGCYIINPSAYAVWETIVDFLNTQFKKMGIKNCYFPIFISEANLQREKDHLEGFEAEVAWVTHGGKEKLASRLAIRPTSETAMYPYYAKKIRSHRDLPLKLNQWNNVVRWEFKHAMPFLRSREFLWQEGHTAHLYQDGADEEVLRVLDHYAAVYEELLAVPVVKGTKTDNEKFAGALYTTTIEGFIPSTGRGIQAATSHCLGQHFSKMFNITVEDPTAKEGEKKPPLNVWQNSFGFTTRSIGVMLLVHSDDRGIVVPPRVAEIQAVIIPVGFNNKTPQETRDSVMADIQGFTALLEAASVRVFVDDRPYSPGWKFNEAELKGIPLKIEYGPNDAKNHAVTASRRDKTAKEDKFTIPIPRLVQGVQEALEQFQQDLFNTAKAEYDAHRKVVLAWDEFVPSLNARNVNIIPHCLGGPCEDEIKELSKRQDQGSEVAEDARAPSMGAKSLCIPFDQPEGLEDGTTKCLNPNCGNLAKKFVLFGRSY